jgi:uncharacterized membrane protein (DUF4010 family)
MTSPEIAPLELAGRLALTLSLAVFLGLAFEEVYKRDERSVPGGVRTFPMLALSGAMLYLIEPRQPFAFTAGLIALAIWLFAFLRGTQVSTTTSLMIPASNLVAYLIGAVALAQPPWVAVAVAVSSVLLLGTREELHKLIQVVPPDELLTAGKFLILVGIILPLVPDQPVSAATPLTPYRVWLAVVAICALSYVSYLLQRYAIIRSTSLLPAILGGLYSSTATTVVLSRRLRQAGAAQPELGASIVAATAVMYLRLGIVVALFNFGIAVALAPALGSLFAGGAALAAYEWRRTIARVDTNLQIPVANPLQIGTAITFAAMLIVLSMLTVWIETAFGRSGVLVLAGLVGATDIDPFVINIAQGGATGLSAASLCAATLIAASSNNLAKAAYTVGFGGIGPASRPALLLVILAAAGLGAAAMYIVTGS